MQRPDCSIPARFEVYIKAHRYAHMHKEPLYLYKYKRHAAQSMRQFPYMHRGKSDVLKCFPDVQTKGTITLAETIIYTYVSIGAFIKFYPQAGTCSWMP
jgi:hypothetical protein